MKIKGVFFILFLLLINNLNADQKKYLHEFWNVRIYQLKKSNGDYIIFAENKNVIPFHISNIKYNDTNLKLLLDKIPEYFVIPPKTNDYKLFELIKKRDNEKTNFYLTNCEIGIGDPSKVNPDLNYPYLPPYEHGKKYRIDQGFNGEATHHGNINEHSLDFHMDIGTPVCAARDGIVFVAEDSFDAGYAFIEVGGRQNEILIMHEDGSFAIYCHMQKRGNIVNIGDYVKKGDLIGHSGDSRGGPHLHFSIAVPHSSEWKTIPFYLLNEDGNLIKPKEGKYYISRHPGREKLGIDLKNSDFENYEKKIKKNNKVKLRYEKVDDDTYVVYIQNGNDYTIDAYVDFDKVNLRESKDLPVNLEVPPLTEKFVLLFWIKRELEKFKFNEKPIKFKK